MTVSKPCDLAGREQRQKFRLAPRLDAGGQPVLRVRHWLQADGGRNVWVPAMTDPAGLEPLSLQRRDKRATGGRPKDFVQYLRGGLARERLEFTADPRDRIAWHAGREGPAAFRPVFQRIIGLMGCDYPDTFSPDR